MASNTLDIIIKLKDLASKNLTKIQAGVKGLEKVSGAAAGKLLNLHTALASLGAFTALKDVVGTFADFDDTMRQVGAVSGAVGQQFEQMTALAKEMGATTRYTASDAAAGMKYLSMAGLDANESMAALPRTLQLAAAAGMDLGRAADIVTNIMTGYGKTAEELGQVNDTLVATFTSSNTSLDELGTAFSYVGPIAKELGLEFNETAASLGLLANAGYKGEKGGAALRNILATLIAPTTNMGKLFDKLGVDTEELGVNMADSANALKSLGVEIKDSSGNIRPMKEILADLQKGLAEIPDAADRSAVILNIFGKRAGPAMAAMLGQGSAALGELKEKIDGLEGIAGDVADQMESGLGGAIRALKSAWEGLRIALGEGIGKTVTASLEFFREKIIAAKEKIEELSQSGEIQQWAEKVKAAVEKTYIMFEKMGSIAARTVKLFSPWIDQLIAIAPYLIATAAGAKALSIAMGLLAAAMKGVETAMAMGTWVAWIKHIQAASTYAGVLKVAMASLGGLLGTLGAAAAAFFAGWEIGKLLNGFTAVRQVAQLLFSYLDEAFTWTTLKLLEFRSAWNGLTGDMAEKAHIDAQIAAQKAYLDQIQITQGAIAGMGKTEKQAAAETVTAETQKTEAIKQTAEEAKAAAEERISAEAQVTSAVKKEIADQIAAFEDQRRELQEIIAARQADIDVSEAYELINHTEAEAQKVEVTRQAYEDRIAILKAYMEEAKNVYGEDSEEVRKIAGEKLAVEREYAKVRLDINNQLREELRKDADADLKLKEAELKQYTAMLEDWEERGVISHRTALEKKLTAEKAFHAERIRIAEAAVQEAALVYGTDSAEYKNAAADKINLELEVKAAIEATTEAIQEGTEAVAEQAQEMYGLQQSVEAVKAASEETSRTVLSVGQAMEMSMAEISRKNLTHAAELLGITDKYADLRAQVKKLGGDTSLLWTMALGDIKEYASALVKMSTQNVNLNFTGTGSPTRPLSEKLKEMGARVLDFAKTVPEQMAMDLDLSGFTKGMEQTALPRLAGMDFNMAESLALAGGMDLKDMGKLDLSIKGKGGSVIGRQDVLKWIKDAVNEEERIGMR